MDNSPPYRRAALALILGAVLSLPIAYLFLQTHSPYEAALDRIVWGLGHHDYSRWALFPALLILPGVRAFHLSQQKSYGSAGLWGYRLAFGGLVLAVFGQIWDYVLFDPWVHSLHGIGFMAQLIAILMMDIGLLLWAVSIFRAHTLSGWQLAIPALWLLYIVGMFIHIFTADENWLYPRYGIDTGIIADVIISVAYVLMGLMLIKTREREAGVLHRF